MPEFDTVRFVVDKAERLDQFLARMLPNQSRSRLVRHLREGGVLVDSRERKQGFRLEPGMLVEVAELAEPIAHDLSPADIDLAVKFEDAHLLVVDKPAGMSVHPSATSRAPTLVHALLAHSQHLSGVGGDFRPGIVHRLDKDTSGLILVAKTDAVHRQLQQAIQERKVKRIYRAWVRGKPLQSAFTIRTFLGRNPKHRQKMAVVSESAPAARLAITHCELLASSGGISEIRCSLETGRTHQIRVHLASVGLPVLGDPTYGVTHPGLARQALHAETLDFHHPVTGEELVIASEIPDDLGRIRG